MHLKYIYSNNPKHKKHDKYIVSYTSRDD